MLLKLTALFGFLAAFELGFIDAFRSDYQYIKSCGAFYKYHPEKGTWMEANSTCWSEGGRLFHPDAEDELNLVLEELGARGVDVYLGFSDFKNLHVYETVDGRPISQVYNKWRSGEPNPGTANEYRCGQLDGNYYLIFVNYCHQFSYPYICKASGEETTLTASLKRQLENLTAAMAVLSANYTTAMEVFEQEAASMKLQAANQAAAMERLTAVEREVAPLKLHASSQSVLLERITVAIENQAGASVNQTRALEKISNALDNNIDVHSEQ